MEVICCNNSICCEPCFGNKLSKKLHARLGYLLLNALSLIVAVILGKLNDNHIEYDSSMHSISFALSLFHLLIIILSLTGSTVVIAMNKGYWTAKFLVILGVYFCCYFTNDHDFYEGYVKFAKYACLGFIIYIAAVSISFGNFLNARLWGNVEALQNAGMSSALWQSLLWGCTIIFYAGGIMFYIDIFEEALDGKKGLTFAFSLIGCGTLLALSIYSISCLVERKRLLASAYVTCFVAYLSWSACFVNDQPFYSLKRRRMDIIFGLCFVLLAILFMVLTSKKIKAVTDEEKELATNPFLEASDVDDNENPDTTAQLTQSADGQEIETYYVTRSYFVYQGFLFFLSIYYSMLMTNWDTYGSRDNKRGFGYWSKFVCAFFTELLYLWVLIAAKCCPNREFDF